MGLKHLQLKLSGQYTLILIQINIRALSRDVQGFFTVKIYLN